MMDDDPHMTLSSQDHHHHHHDNTDDGNLAEISFETLHALGLQAWDSVVVHYDAPPQPTLETTTTTTTTNLQQEQQEQHHPSETSASATYEPTSTTILRLIPSVTCRENVLRIHPLLYECLSYASQFVSIQRENNDRDHETTVTNPKVTIDSSNAESWTCRNTKDTATSTTRTATASSNSLLLAISPWLGSFPYYYNVSEHHHPQDGVEELSFVWKVQPLILSHDNNDNDNDNDNDNEHANQSSIISTPTSSTTIIPMKGTTKVETISSVTVTCLVVPPSFHNAVPPPGDEYDKTHANAFLKDWMATKLKGTLIAPNGSICILSTTNDDYGYQNNNNNSVGNDEGDDAFLLLVVPPTIDSTIETKGETTTTTTTATTTTTTNNSQSTASVSPSSISPSVYQIIDTPQPCSITLVGGGPAVDNEEEGGGGGINENYYDANIRNCPGYQELLQELITLFQFQGIAAPSGILLTGCPGVGKSRMASCVATAIQQQHHHQSTSSRTSPRQILTQIISVQDILLHASYSTESDLVDMILPPEWFKYHHQQQPKTNSQTSPRFLLIVDDLQILLQGDDSSEESSPAYYDPELLQTKNAILQAMDKLIQMTTSSSTNSTSTQQQQQQQCSVLGICQNSTPLTKEFTCVGRLEKEITMPPPTQWQRELILKELLQVDQQCHQNDNITPVQMSEHDNHDNDKLTINTTSIDTLPTLEVENHKHAVPDRWISALIPMTSGCVAGDLRRLCADAWTSAWATTTTKKTSPIDAEQLHLELKDNDTNNISTEDAANHTLPGSAAHVDAETTFSSVSLGWEDLRDAAQRCVPSQLSKLDVIKASAWPKECYRIIHGTTLPDYHKAHDWSWRRFGGYPQVKKRLYRTVVAPWRHCIMNAQTSDEASKKRISNMDGISPPSGVLFHGPPGVGKTFAAGCLASSLGLPVVKVRASDILDQWLGGSEAALRSLFSRARAASPCILFFDEIDAIATNRESSDDSGTDVASRLLSTFLNEMDGISGGAGGGSPNSTGGVLVVAATNRLEALDAALIRPGRLEEHVLLPIPSATDIEDILSIHLEHLNKDTDGVQFHVVAHQLAEFGVSGADIEGFCRGLFLDILRHHMANDESTNPSITNEQVDSAIQMSLANFRQSR